MAKFNPDVPDAADKSYLGLSKPISPYEGDQSGKYLGEAAGTGAKAIGALAASAGQIFGEAVKGADETIKSIIDDKVRTNVNDERAALTTQIQNLGKTNPSIFGDDSEGGGQDGSDVPEQVQSQTEGLEYKGNNLKSGSESGKFPLSYYSMRLESGLKELRDRFPGHVDYIDRTGERISGEQSANKAWQRMLAEYQANANAGQKATNRLQTEAKGYADKTPGGMAAYNKLMQGGYGSDPNTARLNYYKDMSTEITNLGILHTRNLQATDLDKTNTNTWQIGKAVAEDFGLNEVQNLYKGLRISLGIPGSDGNTAEQLRRFMDQNAVSPTKMSEPEAIQKKLYGQQLEERAVQTFKEKMILPTNEYGQPDKNGKLPSIASRMGPEAGKHIEDITNRTIRPMFKQAYEDFTPTKVAVSTYSALMLEAKQSAFNRNMMTNEDIARTMNTVGMLKNSPDYLQGIIQSYLKIQKEDFLLPWSAAVTNTLIEAHREPNDSKVKSTGQIVDKMVSDDPAKSIYNDKDYRTVNDLVRGITNPTANDELKRAIAYRSFFPENKDYLKKFTAGADRSVTWNTFVNPEMSKEMHRLGKDRPEYWTNYKNWAQQEFGNGILHQTLLDLSTTRNPAIQISWNTSSNNWEVTSTKSLREYSAGRQSIGSYRKEDPTAPTVSEFTDIQNKVHTLNAHLNTLSNIGKIDKSEGDVGNYLLRTMATVNPDIAKMPGVPGDMYRTILNAKKAEVEPPQAPLGAGQKGSEKPQDAPTSRKSVSPSQSTRPTVNAPATALNPVNNMTPSGELKPGPEIYNEISHYSPEESRKNIEALFSQFDTGTKQLVLDRKTGKYVPYEPTTIVKGKNEDRVPDKRSDSGETKVATNTTVNGPGNTKYVLRPDGIWIQHDNFGPVGPMPQGWNPPPVRAPGR